MSLDAYTVIIIRNLEWLWHPDAFTPLFKLLWIIWHDLHEIYAANFTVCS